MPLRSGYEISVWKLGVGNRSAIKEIVKMTFPIDADPNLVLDTAKNITVLYGEGTRMEDELSHEIELDIWVVSRGVLRILPYN